MDDAMIKKIGVCAGGGNRGGATSLTQQDYRLGRRQSAALMWNKCSLPSLDKRCTQFLGQFEVLSEIDAGHSATFLPSPEGATYARAGVAQN